MSTDLPLHPLIVHFPLALAFFVPLLAALLLLAWWRGCLPGRRVWAAAVTAQLLLALSAFAALRSGEAEEDRVEPVVGEAALSAHEEAAETFLAGTLAVSALSVLPLLLPGERWRRSAALATLLATLAVAFLAVRTGEAGGELVYRHGAATAYTGAAGGATVPLRHGDDD